MCERQDGRKSEKRRYPLISGGATSVLFDRAVFWFQGLSATGYGDGDVFSSGRLVTRGVIQAAAYSTDNGPLDWHWSMLGR